MGGAARFQVCTPLQRMAYSPRVGLLNELLFENEVIPLGFPLSHEG